MSSLPPDQSPLPRALFEAWRADKATTAELRHGYARFLRGRSSARGLPRAVRWLIAGLVVGLGVAQAAPLTPWRWLGITRGIEVRSAQPASAASARARRSGPGLSRAADPDPVPSAAEAPSSAEPPKAPATPPAIPAPAIPTTPAARAAHVREQWQRAASALRVSNFAQAHQAFLELEHSTSGGERDAARLARAQLLSSHGRGSEARPLLEDLASHAESSTVRSKARALLGWPSSASATAEPTDKLP
jgi:hypothetical protein